MRSIFRIKGFAPYMLVALLNAVTDLGHKIIIQNAIFKTFEGPAQIALTAIVNALILLPFIMLFTPAGFISDRFAKNKVIRISALISVPLTALIALCYHLGLFWPAFVLTFLLAAQSAIYSPAKYGYIKEMAGKDLLAPANAAVQAVTIGAILAGSVLYSVFFEHYLVGISAHDLSSILMAIAPCGYILVAGATLATILSYGLPKRAEGDKTLRLDRKAYLSGKYLKTNLAAVRANEGIWLSIIGLSLFWAINQVLLASFGAHLKEAAGETNTVVAQGLLALGGVGVILGSVFAGAASKNYIETGVIPLGAIGMTVSLFLLPSLSHPVALGALLLFYGVCGGLLVVPLNSLIQFNSRDDELGVVLAGNNFIQNIFMLGFLVLTIAASSAGVDGAPMMYLMALTAAGGAVYTLWKLPQSLLRYVMRALFSQRYQLTVSGMENIPSQGGVLLLGNHASWIDWAMLGIACPRRIRFVMDRDIYSRWYWKWLLERLRVIPISPRGARDALRGISQSLEHGEVVVLFPEGAISRNGQLGAFRRGFEKAAEGVDCSIVPFYIGGLWGSAFSYASSGYKRRSRKGGVRRVTVCFGPVLSGDSNAAEVKSAVTRLSIDAWKLHADSFEPVHLAWLRTARRAPGETAVSDSSGASMSSRKLLAACLSVAGRIRTWARPGANVGILLPPSAAGAIANLAVLSRGAAVVNLNYTMGADRLRLALDAAGIELVISSSQFLTRLAAKGFPAADALEGRRVMHMEDLRNAQGKRDFIRYMILTVLLPGVLLRLLNFRKPKMSDTAAVLFSSGSEGVPKGVMLSHENLMGNVKQVVELLNEGDGEVVLGSLPLFHAFGLAVTTLMPLIEGIPLVCHPDPTDARGVGATAARYKATFLCGTPTFLGLYARSSKVHPLMFRTLRFVVAGAERLSDDVRKAFKDKFNIDAFEGYGATETAPVVAANAPSALRLDDLTVQEGSRPGTVGLPLPGCALRIVDPETLEDMPKGEAGLVLVGGVNVMKGYLNDPERTDEVIFEHGGVRWYKTGDKGRLDEDGFLTIVDRYSRFAKVGGEMVGLAAVEEAVKAAADGLEIAVTAVPDPKRGERLVALVAGDCDPASLRKRMQGAGVLPIMIPAAFVQVEAIPKLGTGKRDLGGAKKLALELGA
jgi:acyl-[acyl-carrier-protein]-phospholipid O-acyltransferase / long-chain-fatty-acid--[acyl-carrier-protein] ligase